MDSFLRIVRLLAMVVWVGGLVFFASVVAPVAFGVLPTRHLAGLVVAGTLGVLSYMGTACYFSFLLATGQLARRAHAGERRLFALEAVLINLMVLANGYVQYRIVPAMERDRIAVGGDVDAAPPDNLARMDFERLHPISEKVESAALFLGLGVVVLMGLEKPSAVRGE
jgi:Domain of unknown function (DUF4149)